MPERGPVQLLLHFLRVRPAPGWKIGLAVALVSTLALLPGEESLYHKAKAGLAQSLRQAAWNHALAGEPEPKPWPWDHSTPAVNSVVPRLGLSAAVQCDARRQGPRADLRAFTQAGRESMHATRIWPPTIAGSPRMPMPSSSRAPSCSSRKTAMTSSGSRARRTHRGTIGRLLSAQVRYPRRTPPDYRSDPGEPDDPHRNRAEALAASRYGRLGRLAGVLGCAGAGCAAGGGGVCRLISRPDRPVQALLGLRRAGISRRRSGDWGGGAIGHWRTGNHARLLRHAESCGGRRWRRHRPTLRLDLVLQLAEPIAKLGAEIAVEHQPLPALQRACA